MSNVSTLLFSGINFATSAPPASGPTDYRTLAMLIKALTIVTAYILGATAFAPFRFDRRSSSPCSGNTPANRSAWCSHSIKTDYTREVPDTGVTREYWLDIVDIIAAPDGVSRPAMGTSPRLELVVIFH